MRSWLVLKSAHRWLVIKRPLRGLVAGLGTGCLFKYVHDSGDQTVKVTYKFKGTDGLIQKKKRWVSCGEAKLDLGGDLWLACF
jgi:hypothetical protein